MQGAGVGFGSGGEAVLFELGENEVIDPILRPSDVFDFRQGLLAERLEGPGERLGLVGRGGTEQKEASQRENVGTRHERYGRWFHESPLCGKAIRRPTDAVAAEDTRTRGRLKPKSPAPPAKDPRPSACNQAPGNDA